ncbi:class B sortase [Bacillus sp. DNRA2]|uniref:class B sortase n=1 Tax=Bacillus sp. DNRA2 TaxID=2723053 RepID=UPI00145E630D|nr:class B sortase [Bacillus sp. DNRA2]NMD72454.1 class B sortase [Bacillus sp. DNRA2]
MILITFIGCTGVTYSIYSISNQLNEYHESASKYDGLREIYEKSAKASSPQNTHDELQKINKDYVGWIDISETTVNYPIVKGGDNEFYLTHNFYQDTDFAGAIFMDSQNSSGTLDKNTIIYGHNMKDKSMFGSLQNYLDQDFFEKHKNVTIKNLNDHTYIWEIFSVYETTKVDWMKTHFENNSDFTAFLKTIENRSIIQSKTEIKEDDTLLTLSTCTKSNDDRRLIIHAKLKKGRNVK